MKTIRQALAAAAVAIVAVGPAVAAETTRGDLTIQHPWARATVGPGAGAAFFSVKNTGDTAEKLVSATADIAQSTELHTHVRDGDVMRMRQVDAIDLPAGATTTLQPGGLHVMFLGMKAPLKAGGTFPLTLSFANAGDVTVEVQVKDMASMSPTGMGTHGSSHGDAGGHQMMEHKSQ